MIVELDAFPDLGLIIKAPSAIRINPADVPASIPRLKASSYRFELAQAARNKQRWRAYFAVPGIA
jgi:hypothetical protein